MEKAGAGLATFCLAFVSPVAKLERKQHPARLGARTDIGGSMLKVLVERKTIRPVVGFDDMG